jgi:hypothetical protein
MEPSGQTHAPAALDREQSSVTTTYSVFGRSERYEEEEKVSVWRESNNGSSVVQPLVSTPA